MVSQALIESPEIVHVPPAAVVVEPISTLPAYKYTSTPATLSGAATDPEIDVVTVVTGEVLIEGSAVGATPPIQIQSGGDSHLPGSVAVMR